MDSAASAPISTTRRLALAWQERIWDRVKGRRRCERLPALLNDVALHGRPVQADLERIVNIIAGRQLTRTVMGEHGTRASLTDFLARGAAQAELLKPFFKSDDTILEYGGGVGRIGHAIAPCVHRLVSVDINPLMAIYGPRLSPRVEFATLTDLPETAQFDGAYCVAVLFHLPLLQQQRALEYVHRRLKPGGWLLVDLKLGPVTEQAEQTAPYGTVRSTALDDFHALYDPLFTARRVPLFNSGFLLRKKDHVAAQTTPAPALIEGRYAVNDASIVADVLEGEVVVVNLDSGAYYILQGSASAIWQWVAAGRSLPEVVTALTRRYPSHDVSALESAVKDFVTQLTGESLLVPATDIEPEVPGTQSALTESDGTPFTAPVMFRYTDMQALIQMDPIREYDETGWPRRRTPAAPPKG